METIVNPYLYFFFFSFTLSIGRATAALDSFFLNQYDLKVNMSESSCRLINHPNLPENRRTLQGRGCMCDEDCIEYRDCCQDSRYYYPGQQSQPSPYTCSELARVYLKRSCSSGWKDSHMAEMCEKSNQNLDSEDKSIILPISNQKTRKTYGNAHCAACNYDQDTESWAVWNLGAACGEAPPGYLKKPPTVYNTPVYNLRNSNYRYSNEPHFTPEINTANRIGYQIGPEFILDINLYIYNDSVPRVHNFETISLPVKIVTNFPTIDTRNRHHFNARFKRLSDSINFQKYASLAKKIALGAKFDPYNRKFVSKYDGKDFVCEFFGLPPENSKMFTRNCVPSVISSCPESYKNASVVQQCSTYTQIVYTKDSQKPYRNKDCARCHEEKEDNTSGYSDDNRTEGGIAEVLAVANTKPEGLSAKPSPEVEKKFASKPA